MTARSLLLPLVALGLAACSITPKQRIERDPAAFAAVPAEQQEKVRRGEIAVGFDQPTVRLALGAPDRVIERENADGQSEVWTYYTATSTSGYAGCNYGFPYYGFPYYGRQVYCPPLLNQYEERMRVVFKDGKVTAVDRVR